MKRTTIQQLERLDRVWSGVTTTIHELIQFYEFLQEAELTFPNACGDFANDKDVAANAPIFTMCLAFKNSVITSIAKLHDRDQNAASIPNALAILFRKDIEEHLRKLSLENFDHNMSIVHALGEQLPADHRYSAARYFRDKQIAHRDMRFKADAHSLSRDDIATIYMFTVSIVEAVNQMLGVKPISYTQLMNRWIIIATEFMKSIPHHNKIPGDDRQRIDMFFLGTRDELEADLGIVRSP